MGDSRSGPAGQRRADNSPTAASQQETTVELTIGPKTVPLSVVEWGGGILAALGFALTPAFTGIPAGYCALKLHEHKPATAYGILALVAASAVFWGFFLFADSVAKRASDVTALSVQSMIVLVLIPVSLLGVVLGGLALRYLDW